MGSTRITTRKSNIELLRIVLMLLIIAHHYVVNSGLTDCFDYQNPSFKMFFFQCFGAFGKVGVNCFVLITGYFMVTSGFSLKKWLRLYLEVKFYTIVIYLIFLAFGRISFNYHEFLETLFSVIFGIGNNYADTFLILYLLIPFLNVLANKLDFRSYSLMLGILLLVMTIIPTFSLFLSVLHTSNDTWNYLFWMIVVYLLGGYLGLYQAEIYQIARLTSSAKKFALLITNLLLVLLWIVFYDLFGVKHDMGSPYWFVNDANKLLALSCAVSMLIWFLSVDMKHNKWINRIAATTFGVFLIHTSGNYMREFLWRDVFRVTDSYQMSLPVIRAVSAVVIVFAVCAVIDSLRSKLMETPLFALIDRRSRNR